MLNTLEPPSSKHPAELFAEACLAQCAISADQVVRLTTLLDSDPNRKGHPSDGFVWGTGACVHGGVHALRTNARSFPAVTRMLAMYAKQWVRDHPFTSLILFADVQAPLHSDRNNAAGVNNFLIGLTDFVEGELWIESSSGSQACPDPAYQGCGVLLPVSRTCAFFNAHARHATCPWTGSRVVLAGFTVKGYNAFERTMHDTLTGLGFQIPQVATGDFICQTLKPPPQPSLGSGLVLIFETFSGTGRVTACLRKLGVSAAHAVDHCVHNEAAALPLLADLTTPEGRELCWFWLRSPLLVAVFAAPPCGTSSRAREIPCYDSRGNLLSSPQPLRSQQHPDGLPTHAGSDRVRVSKANALYHFLSDVVDDCHRRNVLCAIENPQRSWYWATSAFCRIKHICAHAVSFDHCAFGGPRPKRTTIASTLPCFASLAKDCPGEACAAKHEPWGLGPAGFATKQETAYPPELAASIAHALARHACRLGWNPEAPLQQPRSLQTACQSVVGSQPKASRFPPLVPEHARVVVMTGPCSLQLPCDAMQRIKAPWTVPQHCSCALQVIPAEAQLLRVSPISDNVGDKLAGQRQGELRNQCEVAWGIPFKPEAFVQEAVKSGHPKLLPVNLPQPLEKAVEMNRSYSKEEMKVFREKWFRKWERRAEELRPQEEELKNHLPEHLRSILDGKGLLVWREILQDLGYKDLGVVEEVARGTELLGQVPLTGVFEQSFKPAVATPEQVQARAVASREKVLSALKSQGNLDKEVKDKSLKEVVSKRFGLEQGTGENRKVRLVDDLSSSTVNDAVQTCESPKPHGVEVVSALCMKCMDSMPRRSMSGRCYDLKAAYRQLGLSESALDASFVTFPDPESGEPVIYQTLALPFGAARSVYSFLRVSHSIWFIGCAIGFMWANYYDDYPILCPDDDVESLDAFVPRFFRLLGWRFAEDGSKAEGFGKTFSCLGVVFNLQSYCGGRVEVDNTPSRKHELQKILRETAEQGMMSISAAQKLRGRMQFADGQVFGRASRLCLQAVTEHIVSGRDEIGPACKNAMLTYANILEVCKPRILARPCRKPVYLFTDAAFDRSGGKPCCGIGGILYDCEGKLLRFFSHFLSVPLMQKLGLEEEKTIIF